MASVRQNIINALTWFKAKILTTTISTSVTNAAPTSAAVATALNAKAPTAHASTATTYGLGTASNYGHVKLSDTYATAVTNGAAANGIVPSQNALYNAYNELNSCLINRTRQNIVANVQNGNLAAAASEQNLAKYGLRIGDYFAGASGYEYIVADMDTFYGGRDAYAVVNQHHIGLVVNTKTTTQWNETNDTSTGYAGSVYKTYIHNTVLENVQSDIEALTGDVWSAHMVGHQLLWSTGTGAWTWSGNNEYISALSSVQVFGSPICDMNYYHTGEANKPLAVFQKFWYPQIFGGRGVWLRSVASAS